MTTSVVLDTSVLIKLFIPEDNSTVAKELLSEFETNKTKIYCPNFGKIEFISTLAKKHKLNLLDINQVRLVIEDLEETNISYIKEDLTLLKKALSMAYLLQETTIYDCVFLALAEKIGGTYITADNLFYQKAVRHYAFISNLAP